MAQGNIVDAGDVLIVGAGLAGLFTALKLAPRPVTVLAGAPIGDGAAAIEQGPTFAQPQYVVTRVQGQITASFEMFQDRTDLASEMAVLIQKGPGFFRGYG